MPIADEPLSIAERGRGVPVVLIPGFQGRWEYFEPALQALASSCRAVTFSLAGEPGSDCPFEPARRFDGLCDQVEAVLDRRRLERAALCGISFGGLVALRFAATRPDRTSALVLVSTPAPGFLLKRRHVLYARVPWLFGAAFLAELPIRVGPEIKAAIDDPAGRRRFALQQLRTFAAAPLSVSRMAARARLIGARGEADLRRQDAARVSAPTLVITGEPGLDHVVPADATSEYASLIAGARSVQLSRSGHLGCITRPQAFAAAVAEFLASAGIEADSRGRMTGDRHDAA